MFILLSLIQIISSAWSQSSSPLIDPDKFTICAITINSDDEKKVFQAQAKKYPKKFNPVVELTDMGDDADWFQNACSSGIRCDQLVISGHFGGEFFGEKSQKTLSLNELEKAGCSKTCENIISKPYEVFLFGCNTLATKDEDHRTPAQYLEVLLQDGFTATQAAQVVESRYGSIGDSNRASMQRAFSGESKQLYGFNSVGPSGKNVKAYLENYFKKTPAAEHLEKLQAKRIMTLVDLGNKNLAESLKNTAFAQCGSDNFTDPKSQKICTLADTGKSVDEKLALTLELMTKEDWLSYLPAVNNFLSSHPIYSFNSDQVKSLELISKNETIKRQVLALIEKTNSLGLKYEWNTFALNLGFIDHAEFQKRYKNAVFSLLNKPLSSSDKDSLCSMNFHSISASDLEGNDWNDNNLEAFGCFELHSPEILKAVEKRLILAKNKQSLKGTMSYLWSMTHSDNPNIPKPFQVSSEILKKIKELSSNKDSDINEASVSIWAGLGSDKEELNKKLQTFLFSKSAKDQMTAIKVFCQEIKDVDSKAYMQMLNLIANSSRAEFRAEALEQLAYKSKFPIEVINKLESLQKSPKLSKDDKGMISEILSNNLNGD